MGQLGRNLDLNVKILSVINAPVSAHCVWNRASQAQARGR